MTHRLPVILLICLLALAGCGQSGRAARIQALMGADTRPAEADLYSALLQARYASQTNDPEAALDAYRRALDALPGEAALRERAVFSALMAGDFEAASQLAGEAESASSEAGDALLRLTRAVDALRSGDPDEAELMLAGAGRDSYTAGLSRNLRAWIALEQRGPEEAEAELLGSARDASELDAVSVYTLALLHLNEGNDQRASELLADLWTHGPRLALATETEARLMAARGNRQGALQRLLEFRAEAGGHPATETLLSRIEAGEAISVPRPDLSAGAAQALFMPAVALASQEGGDVAGVYFTMSLALDPEFDLARLVWAASLEQAGRSDAALALLSEVKPGHALYGAARGQMAWIYRRQGDTDRALTLANEALAARPSRDLAVQLGDLMTSLGRDGEAEILFTRILAEDARRGETDWRLLFARGALRERVGRWPEAEADLRAALALAPDNAQLLNHLGYSLVDRGQNLDEAMAMISRAANLDPRSGLILDSLGWAYFRLGDYERAVFHLERAAELEPADPVINEHLGDAYWQVGRYREARFQWRRALEVNEEANSEARLSAKLAGGVGAAALGEGAP